MGRVHVHSLRIYYEDTDHSGVVYHANYLKYCDRAREHMLGIDKLTQLLDERGLGFAVYRADLRYLEGAVFGDAIEVHSTVKLESAFRLGIQQNVMRKGQARPLVECRIELVCLIGKKLTRVPDDMIAELARYNAGDDLSHERRNPFRGPA